MNYLSVLTSFRKELWEFRKTLFWVPLIIAIIMIATPLLKFMLMEDYQLSRIFDNLAKVDNLENVQEFTHFFLAGIMGVFVPFLMVSLVIQLYYFISCLFDERRDLSVYFWRSLPVPDSLTIGVKLLTGAIIVPGIFMLAASFVVLIFLLLGLCISGVLAVGYDISLWAIWSNAEIVTNLASVWLNLLPYALWMFPVFAWLMLASMFANRAPFLWAILPVVVLLLIESYLVEYFNLDNRFLLTILRDYFEFGQEMLPQDISTAESPKLVLFSVIASKISLIATLIGAGLIYLTYWLRVNRS